MEQIKKVATLFKTVNVVPFIETTSSECVIAGGSVVYALNNFVPAETVGDIDIFVNSKKLFWDTIVTIRNTFDVQSYLNYGIDFSTVAIELKDERVMFQLIYKKWKEPEDIIRSFDLDYVQCGIHKGELMITPECKESHEKREVIRFRDLRFREGRMAKAVKKGFKCPIIEGYNRINSVPRHITFEELKENIIRPFKESIYTVNMELRNKWYLVKNLKIVGFKWEPEKSRFIGSIFGKFVVDIGDGETVLVDKVSYRTNIIENNGYTLDVDDDNLSTFFRLKHYDRKKDKSRINKEIKEGPTTILISAYLIKQYDPVGKRLHGKVHNIYSDADGIPFDKNFKIGTEVLLKKHEEYNIITTMIEELDDSDKPLDQCKCSAYKCFLSYATNGKEKEAIEKACSQMNIDYHKYFTINGSSSLMTLGLAMFGQSVKTVSGMIDFIEGFH